MLTFTLEQHGHRLLSGSSCAVLGRLPRRLPSSRAGWTSRSFSKLQVFMAAQENPHVRLRVTVQLLPGFRLPPASIAANGVLLLQETKSSKRLSWYQKLGQSVNPSGISMFGQVFLVRIAPRDLQQPYTLDSS